MSAEEYRVYNRLQMCSCAAAIGAIGCGLDPYPFLMEIGATGEESYAPWTAARALKVLTTRDHGIISALKIDVNLGRSSKVALGQNANGFYCDHEEGIYTVISRVTYSHPATADRKETRVDLAYQIRYLRGMGVSVEILKEDCLNPSLMMIYQNFLIQASSLLLAVQCEQFGEVREDLVALLQNIKIPLRFIPPVYI